MRSPVPTPELIERVMVRDPRAAEILASKSKCADRLCQHTAKFVVLSPQDGTTPIAVCGTHKNDRLRLWAWNEMFKEKAERRAKLEREVSYAINLATMLTDARHNVVRVCFGNDDRGNITLSRDEAQKLLTWLS